MNIESGELGKAEAFKNAAQIIVNNFTAAAIYPNELSDVVNTYIEQNVAVYEEIVGAGKDYSKEIERYTYDREHAFGNDHPFTESNVNKSEPISGQPQISALNLDKK